MLYISGVPVIGKPELKLNNNGLTSEDLMTYYAECMKKMAIFLLIVLCTQLTLNISYLIDKCQGNAGKNAGAAILYTLIPCLLIFGVMMALVAAYPGFKNVFSDVIGYFAISGKASEILTKVLIDTNINKAIESEGYNMENTSKLIHDAVSRIQYLKVNSQTAEESNKFKTYQSQIMNVMVSSKINQSNVGIATS